LGVAAVGYLLGREVSDVTKINCHHTVIRVRDVDDVHGLVLHNVGTAEVHDQPGLSQALSEDVKNVA
jgi:hypothetical protein